jgi:RND family efflux transporter MFP subunit
MRWFTRLTVVWTAAALVSAGCDSAPPAANPTPPKVSVAQPETRQLVEYDNYNGWIDSPEKVEVRARVRGHIMKVSFSDGDRVTKGQMLFQLDPVPLQQEVDRSIAQVKIFQTQLDQALVEQKRMEDLVKKNAATPLELEQATMKAKALEAQVEAQKLEVDRRKQELSYATIPAEISGRIGKSELDVGNLVNAGGSDPLLATIVSFDPVQIYFDVDERSLQRYQKMSPATQPGGVIKGRGMKFIFGLETDEGYPNEGELDFADNKVNADTGTIRVRGVIANAQGRFIPGSRVRVRLPIGKERPVRLVPDTAILSDQDRRYVLVVGKDNIVARKDIMPGRLLDDGMRIVLPAADGELGADETIITQGLQMARLHYPVEPIKSAATTQPAQPATTQPAATASR